MAMLPLIFIGVVLGLLVFGKSLDFFAMLGLLGLIGMNIKNAIVLVDEIGLQLNAGLSPVNAVIEATKTRIVPVTMASGTTILGMLPLLGDAMFAGMAATIMGGLFVSTILTIFVLPVTYCVFFKIKIRVKGMRNKIIIGCLLLGALSAKAQDTRLSAVEYKETGSLNTAVKSSKALRSVSLCSMRSRPLRPVSSLR